jgi:hypothetical protein
MYALRRLTAARDTVLLGHSATQRIWGNGKGATAGTLGGIKIEFFEELLCKCLTQ